MLAAMAESECHQEIDDWYLFLGSASCNAKVRRNRLKVKRLVEERFGFQRWASIRHSMVDDSMVDDTTGGPIDLLVDELGVVDPPRSVAKAHGVPFGASAVAAIHVNKWRRRFELGPMRAEATEVVVDGHPDRLTTVAIEGCDLDDLIRLRAELGLDRHPNLAYHLALAPVLGRAA